MMSKLSFAAYTRFAMVIVLNLGQPAPSHARDENLMLASPMPMHNSRQAQTTPKYQRFPYYWPNCPDGFDIPTQEECSEAIVSLGVTNGGEPWTGSRTTMPRFCILQKNTDSTIFNTDPTGDQRRWDLAPVCKWSGEVAPPDFFRASREDVTEWRGVVHTITVKPEEWDYFLAFQESRKNGFSCPCNPGSECNEIKAPGKHWHPPNPEKATYDCTLWDAAWLHAEDQCIQGYFSHDSKDGSSPRMRCEAVGAVYKGEHQAGRHTTGLGALTGLQTSPGHCNSMFDPLFRGFAVAHGARRNDPRGDGDVWTVLYNDGGTDISDSESCIPAGYTATGEQTQSQPTTPPQLIPTQNPITPTPGPPSNYQKLDYGEDACPEGLVIDSESECSEAIVALGITNGGDPWTGSVITMPIGCSVQKVTNTMIFNMAEVGSGRHDLAPVCKLTGNPEPDTPSPVASPPEATPTASPVGDNVDDDPCEYTGPTVQVKIEIMACKKPKKIRWKIKPAEVPGCKTFKKGRLSKKVKPCDLYKKNVKLHVGKKYKIIVMDKNKNKILNDAFYEVWSGGNVLVDDGAFGKKSTQTFMVPS